MPNSSRLRRMQRRQTPSLTTRPIVREPQSHQQMPTLPKEPRSTRIWPMRVMRLNVPSFPQKSPNRYRGVYASDSSHRYDATSKDANSTLTCQNHWETTISPRSVWLMRHWPGMVFQNFEQNKKPARRSGPVSCQLNFKSLETNLALPPELVDSAKRCGLLELGLDTGLRQAWRR